MELILIIFNIALYWRTINFGLIMDDESHWQYIRTKGFTTPKEIINIAKLKQAFDEHFYSGTTFGTNTKVEHSFTLFLHILTALMIYWFMGHNQISLWAALLYSCNPITNQTAIWLNGRRYAFNVILVLMMVESSKFGFWGDVVGMMIYFPTGLFHMTAIFAPILLGWPWIFLAAIIFLFFAKEVKSIVLQRYQAIGDGELKRISWNRLTVIVKSYGFYFWKIIYPGLCAMIYPNLFMWGKKNKGNEDAYAINWDFFKGTLCIGVSVGMFIFCPPDLRPFICFMFLSIIQWCNILPVLQVLADRYASVPTVFMMFMISYNANMVMHQYAWIYLTLMVMYYCLCLSEVMRMYPDIIHFYNYHLEHFPAMPIPRATFIASCLQSGMIKEAEGLTRQGLEKNPSDYAMLIYGATMSIIRGDYKNGMVFIDEAENNFYLGQEIQQRKEIKHFREQLEVVRRLTDGQRK